APQLEDAPLDQIHRSLRFGDEPQNLGAIEDAADADRSVLPRQVDQPPVQLDEPGIRPSPSSRRIGRACLSNYHATPSGLEGLEGSMTSNSRPHSTAAHS